MLKKRYSRLFYAESAAISSFRIAPEDILMNVPSAVTASANRKSSTNKKRKSKPPEVSSFVKHFPLLVQAPQVVGRGKGEYSTANYFMGHAPGGVNIYIKKLLQNPVMPA